MLIQTNHRQDSRSDEAYRQLVAFIEEERAVEGARLPSEVELADMFGTSRTSVREALVRLRAEGRATSRRGSGTFLVSAKREELLQLSAIESIRDIIDWHEFRVAMESEIAALSAERRTDQEMLEMRRRQEVLMETLAVTSGEKEDAAFHHALAQGAHSVKLMEASKTLASHIFRWAEVTRRHMVLTLEQRREIIAVEHGDIIEAIELGKAADARLAVRRHLLNGRARLLSSLSL
jgi:GntR family transcriptional repressor for pyruvate dehydrogenase complex